MGYSVFLNFNFIIMNRPDPFGLGAALDAWDAETPDVGDIRVDQDRKEAMLFELAGVVDGTVLSDAKRALDEVFPGEFTMNSRSAAAQFDAQFEVAGLQGGLRDAMRKALLAEMPSR